MRRDDHAYAVGCAALLVLAFAGYLVGLFVGHRLS